MARFPPIFACLSAVLWASASRRRITALTSRKRVSHFTFSHYTQKEFTRPEVKHTVLEREGRAIDPSFEFCSIASSCLPHSPPPPSLSSVSLTVAFPWYISPSRLLPPPPAAAAQHPA